MFKDLSSPFFILANPRSGSSLLRLVCDSNSNLIVPPESGFLEWWYKKYKNWDESWIDHKLFLEFIDDLLSSKKFEIWNFDVQLFKNLVTNEKPKNYSSLMSLVYYSYSRQQEKSIVRWGDKNNYYIHRLDLLYKIFPNAKFIHLIRDGRDVAVSYRNIKKIDSKSPYKPQLPAEMLEIAKEWDSNINKINSFLNTIPEVNQLEIKYEDLLKNTKISALKICDFLNVPYEEEMLHYYRRNLRHHTEPKATLDWKKKTLQKPDISNIGKYIDELTETELQIFESECLTTLKKYSYV